MCDYQSEVIYNDPDFEDFGSKVDVDFSGYDLHEREFSSHKNEEFSSSKAKTNNKEHSVFKSLGEKFGISAQEFSFIKASYLRCRTRTNNFYEGIENDDDSDEEDERLMAQIKSETRYDIGFLGRYREYSNKEKEKDPSSYDVRSSFIAKDFLSKSKPVEAVPSSSSPIVYVTPIIPKVETKESSIRDLVDNATIPILRKEESSGIKDSSQTSSDDIIPLSGKAHCESNIMVEIVSNVLIPPKRKEDSLSNGDSSVCHDQLEIRPLKRRRFGDISSSFAVVNCFMETDFTIIRPEEVLLTEPDLDQIKEWLSYATDKEIKFGSLVGQIIVGGKPPDTYMEEFIWNGIIVRSDNSVYSPRTIVFSVDDKVKVSFCYSDELFYRKYIQYIRGLARKNSSYWFQNYEGLGEVTMLTRTGKKVGKYTLGSLAYKNLDYDYGWEYNKAFGIGWKEVGNYKVAVKFISESFPFNEANNLLLFMRRDGHEGMWINRGLGLSLYNKSVVNQKILWFASSLEFTDNIYPCEPPIHCICGDPFDRLHLFQCKSLKLFMASHPREFSSWRIKAKDRKDVKL